MKNHNEVDSQPEATTEARRDFLKLAGMTATAAAVTGCGHGDPYALPKPDVPGASAFAQGEEQWVASACGQCEAGCGVRVRVVEGRAVKLTGNSNSVINAGGIGPRAQAGCQVLYDPDRVVGPMRRLVPKGEPATGDEAWEQVSWETALEELGDYLLELREDERGNELCVVTGQERGSTRDLLARFAESFGTRNFMDGRAKRQNPAAAANLLMQGIDEVPAYDWADAELVVSLGAEVLQASCQKVHFARASGSNRRRARLVHVGTARTTTADLADEFLQIRTGTFGAFALGLAAVVVAKGLHDRTFLEQHCAGFEDWIDPGGIERPGLRTLLESYTPETVSELCGIDAAAVEALGSELGNAAPGFAIPGAESYQTTGGVHAAMAVHALNAVLGSIDRPGGVLTQRLAPLDPWDELEPDEYAEETLELAPIWDGLASSPLAAALFGPNFDDLPEALEAGTIDTLLLHYTNPLWSRPDAARWQAALAKLPMVISFSPHWDETSLAVADWILPDNSFLERWEDAGPSPSVGYPVYSLRQPVVEPVHDTRQTADVLLEWARTIDEGVLEALPWKDSKDLVKKQIIGIYKAKRGSIVESKGSSFLKAFYAAGGWHDKEYRYQAWEEVLRTDSGKLELASMALYDLLAEAGREDAAELCMPRHVEPELAGDLGSFPLTLVPFRPSTYAEGGSANLPLLQELRLHPDDRPWRTQVWVHPDTAAEAGVEAGGAVTVATPEGQIDGYARFDDGVQRGELHVPRGHGHTAMGRFAAGWGGNVNELISLTGRDPIFGTTPWLGTRAVLRRNQA